MENTFVTALAMGATPYAVNLRHRLHRRPETALNEHETTALIIEELNKLGAEIQDIGLETGCVGLIRGLKPGEGKVIGLRSDIDALPMEDMCGQPWASEIAGVAHTCGHDSHTACLLGAAKVLMQLRDRFSGTVKLVFQPGEEGLHGARILVAKGVLENPRVDQMTALHCTPAYKLGTFAVSEGRILAASDRFIIRFVGRSAHASRPVEGQNALLAAAHATLALAEIVPNEVNTKEEAVVNTCIADSGTATNIVPDEAIIRGTVRTLTPTTRDTIERSIRRIAESAAAMCGCKTEVSYNRGCPPVSNDAEVTRHLRSSLSKIVGKANVLELKPLLGGEDFSMYTEALGGNTAFYRLGCGCDGMENGPTLHNSHFDFNDAAMPYGIAAHVQYVLDVI